jgi:hypothetical protein
MLLSFAKVALVFDKYLNVIKYLGHEVNETKLFVEIFM